MLEFKNLAEATRAAVRSGAQLDVGGRTINAAGARMQVLRPQPAPAAPPDPDPLDRVAELMRLQVTAAAEQQERLTAALEALARKAAEPPPPPVQAAPQAHRALISVEVVRDPKTGRAMSLAPVYTQRAGQPMATSFSIERDEKGRIERLVSTT